MKTRSSFCAIAPFVQSLQNSTQIMFDIKSDWKKNALLFSAVLTLGLWVSPAKADQVTAETNSATTPAPELSQSETIETTETSEMVLTAPSTPEVATPEVATTEDTAIPAAEPAPMETIDSVSSTDLTTESAPEGTLESTTIPGGETPSGDLAQSPTDPDTSDVDPGRTTRSGSSYIAVGGNIGIGDEDTGVGESSFAILSKVGLTSNISARPAVLFSDDVTILVPLTLDFAFGDTEPSEEVSDDLNLSLNPYIGAGVAISTGGDGSVDFLATGGLDIPITSRFTGTAALNAVFFDDIALGITLGIGYNF
ncbi:hypothetical protein [Oscillatoria sp. FACHB-1407]|uniref:hypothetical protein n=1 Tax=Oscillatoria sp. FACHB-1407 TaxID=2692847 RepID=UPI001689AB88|nr:hypothetical protein [Oscillatoria sp. FACHB-1407]